MQKNDLNPIYRNLSLILEAQTAIKYLRLGLGNIQKISAKNDFYHPVFLYLSGGIERLLKVMLCLNYQERESSLPSFRKLLRNNNGHDLVFLKGELAEIIANNRELLSQEDYDIIISDRLVIQIFDVLSEFGKRGRYFNLDAVMGTAQDYNVQSEWNKIEKQVGIEYFGIDKYNDLVFATGKLDFLFQTTNELIVSSLEKLFRALTRLILKNKFSNNGNYLTFEVEVFTDISDNDLGKTDYNKFQIYEWVRR